jgi:spore germination protein (amino acid permease)
MQLGKFITLRQILFLLYLSKTAASPFFLTNFMIPEAGIAAWQLLLGADIYVLLGSYLVIKLAEKYPAENCITYMRKLLGNFAGLIPLLVLIAYFLFQVMLLSRGVADVTRLGLLPVTPQWAIVVLFLWPVAYAVSYGITPLARIVDGVLLFGFPVVLFSFVTMISDVDFDFFTGLWLWKPAIFISLNFFATFNYVSCFIILYVLYPYIQASPRQIMGSTVMALAVASTFIYAPITYLPMLIFGPEGVLEYRAPLYSAIKIAPISFYIIEDVSVIFFAVWTILSFAGASLYMFCAMQILYPLLPVKKGRWLIPFGLVPPLAYLSTSQSIAEFLPWLRYSGVATFFIAIVLPALLLLVHAIKQRKERPHESAENI